MEFGFPPAEQVVEMRGIGKKMVGKKMFKK
jgi:hypothetical protein